MEANKRNELKKLAYDLKSYMYKTDICYQTDYLAYEDMLNRYICDENMPNYLQATYEHMLILRIQKHKNSLRSHMYLGSISTQETYKMVEEIYYIFTNK